MEQYYYQWSLQGKDIQIGRSNYNNYHCHFHSDIEIKYAMEGGFCAIVDEAQYELEQGDLLVVFPYQLHQYMADSRNHLELVITVKPRILNEYQKYFSSMIPECPVIKSEDISEECHAALKWLAKTRSFDEDIMLLRRSLISAVFWFFIHNAKLKETTTNHFEEFQKVIRYCEEHFLDEKCSLEMVSKSLGLSKFHISRLFSQRLKTSFTSYINALRINHACHLLNTTNETVTYIALTCGYTTIRHFNRIFLEITGTTPREFRNQKSK